MESFECLSKTDVFGANLFHIFSDDGTQLEKESFLNESHAFALK